MNCRHYKISQAQPLKCLSVRTCWVSGVGRRRLCVPRRGTVWSGVQLGDIGLGDGLLTDRVALKRVA